MTAARAVYVVGAPAFADVMARVVQAAEGLRVAGVFGPGEVPSFQETSEPVVILDSGEPPSPSFSFLALVLAVAPRARVLVVCREGLSAADVVRFRDARCLLPHDVPARHLAMAVLLVEESCGPLVLIPPQRPTLPRRGDLTPREREVLELVGQALTNSQIARRLGISEGTVKRHVYSVFAKLGAVSRLDAVNKYAAPAFPEAVAVPLVS